jgi:hypothetical protein
MSSAEDLSVPSLRMPGTVLRPRVLGSNNVVVGGLLISQQMQKDSIDRTCSARYGHFSTYCDSLSMGNATEQASEKEPYGTDPGVLVHLVG